MKKAASVPRHLPLPPVNAVPPSSTMVTTSISPPVPMEYFTTSSREIERSAAAPQNIPCRAKRERFSRLTCTPEYMAALPFKPTAEIFLPQKFLLRKTSKTTATITRMTKGSGITPKKAILPMRRNQSGKPETALSPTKTCASPL